MKKGGASARDVGGGSKLRHLLERPRRHRLFVGVVKLHQSQVGINWNIDLGFDEGIESRDGSSLQWVHGAGTVEDEGDFSELGIHRIWSLAKVGWTIVVRGFVFLNALEILMTTTPVVALFGAFYIIVVRWTIVWAVFVQGSSRLDACFRSHSM
jgi:hypothetical protein